MENKSLPWFYGLMCLGLAITLFFLSFRSPVSVSTSIPTRTELRGVWLTNVASGVLFSPWGVQRAINKLSHYHFNTLYPVVWNRGHTFYPSGVIKKVTGRDRDPLLKLMHPGRDPLAEMIQEGHRQGFKVIPWFEYGLMVPKSSLISKRHPDWLTQSLDKSQIDYEDELEKEITNSASKKRSQPLPNLFKIHQNWLNPLHPEVREFIKRMIVEVVTNYDVDGIQLDDHFGMPVEMGYDPLTIETYQKQQGGRKPPTNPYDPAWIAWRASKLTDFMTEIKQAVKAVKPNCIISLSPNSQTYSYHKYLQNWRNWVERGLVDELILQVYRNDTKRFLEEINQPAVQLAKQKIPVSIAILSGVLTRPVSMKQIKTQVELIRAYGFAGVSFFYWESLWGYITPESPQQRREGFLNLFPDRAQSPLVLKVAKSQY